MKRRAVDVGERKGEMLVQIKVPSRSRAGGERRKGVAGCGNLGGPLSATE